MTDLDGEEQLLRAAWYYYVDNLTQDEVAKRLAISRAGAGRLLDRARQTGIVSISIQSASLDAFRIGRQLRAAYNLREAVVPPPLDKSTQSDVNRRLALAAAQYLRGHLPAGSRLALGWGETVAATVDCLPTEIMSNLSTCTLTGGVNNYVPALRRLRVQSNTDISDVFIPAPIVVSSERLAATLRSEETIDNAIALNRSADVALIGIGGVQGEVSLIQQGYLTAEQLAGIESSGAVGDVLGLFYDAHGQLLDLEIHQRRIGVELNDLRSIKSVVAVAGGTSKTSAIRGALEAGLIDVLVTSEDVARELLDLADMPQPEAS